MSTERLGTLPTTGNGFLGDVWITLKRWLVKTTRNPMVMLVSLIQPVIFLVLFSQVFGGITSGFLSQRLGENVDYITYLVPAIVIQSAFLAAGSSGVGLVSDMENGMFDKLLVSPVRPAAMFLGKALSETVRIVIQTVIILGLGVVFVWLDTSGSVGTYVATGIPGAIGIVVIAMVFAIWFAGVSNILAVVTGDDESTTMAMMTLQFPLLFLSSAFVPLYALPDWVQVIAKVNPITYGIDATRTLMIGQNVPTVLDVSALGGIWSTVVPALLILGVLDIVIGAIAVRFLSRASSS